MIKSLERKIGKSNPDVIAYAEQLSGLVNDIKRQARSISRGLVTVDFRNNGFIMTLENLISHTEQYSGVTCTLTNELDGPITDEAIATHFYRICQEALNNALSHSSATQIDVELLQDEELILLRITDNGSGLKKRYDRSGGLGLRIMSYRARMINATLEISEPEGGGTVVSCSVLYSGVTV